MLGLLKLFSLVSFYNQLRFEKDLERSLAEAKYQEELDNMHQHLNHPSDEFVINKYDSISQLNSEI
jgi:hypothetical protein